MSDDLDMLVNAVVMADLSRRMLMREGVPDHEIEMVYHETLGAAMHQGGEHSVLLVMRLAHFAATCIEMLAAYEGTTGPVYLQKIALAQASEPQEER